MNDFVLAVGSKIDGTEIQKQLNALPVSQRTVTVSVKGDTTQVKEMITSGNKAYTTLKQLDSEGKTVSTTLTKVSESSKSAGTSLKEASTHANTFGSKILDITKKVLAFGAVTKVIGLFTQSIGEAVESVKTLDASLVELRKVTDLNGASLEDYTETAFRMASELSSTASDVTDAVTEFAKSNYTLAESQALAKQAIIFQTIADGAISASSSATVLIQTMKAYNMTAEESVSIIDAINEVDVLAFPFGNLWVIKDNYISQTLGIDKTEERLFDKKINVDDLFKICYNIQNGESIL